MALGWTKPNVTSPTRRLAFSTTRGFRRMIPMDRKSPVDSHIGRRLKELAHLLIDEKSPTGGQAVGLKF
jgi:hypothetical protein